jgi:hypothetical protein
MKEVTLQIDDSKFKFFMELVQSLDFVKVKEVSDYNEPTKKEILEGIQQGMKEASLIQMGILKGQPIKELLDELQ